MVGGEGVTVEIDESKFSKSKNVVGKKHCWTGFLVDMNVGLGEC